RSTQVYIRIPYTSLFRSGFVLKGRVHFSWFVSVAARSLPRPWELARFFLADFSSGEEARRSPVAERIRGRAAPCGPARIRITGRDRKSTRLNSSHVKISY